MTHWIKKTAQIVLHVSGQVDKEAERWSNDCCHLIEILVSNGEQALFKAEKRKRAHLCILGIHEENPQFL